MNIAPKMLIIGGIVLLVIGLLWLLGGRFLSFGRLPGDVVVEKENFKFYFPIVTCIALSVIVSLLLFVVRWFMK